MPDFGAGALVTGSLGTAATVGSSEAARGIREWPWGRSILSALPGRRQESDKVQSREAGGNGQLAKPVSLPDSKELLAEAETTR